VFLVENKDITDEITDKVMSAVGFGSVATVAEPGEPADAGDLGEVSDDSE